MRLLRFIIILTAFAIYYSKAVAQSSGLMVVCEATAGSNQVCFRGTSLDESCIKQYWNQGFRVTSAAHSGLGWIVAMHSNTLYKRQLYYFDSAWPSGWLNKCWNAGMEITTMASGDGKWFMVASEVQAPALQSVCSYEDSRFFNWLYEKKSQGYYLTAATSNGDQWGATMTKTPEFTDQQIIVKNTYEAISKEAQAKWNEGWSIQQVVSRAGAYMLVVCKRANGIRPSWTFNEFTTASPEQFISKAKSEGKFICALSGYGQRGQQPTNTYQASTLFPTSKTVKTFYYTKTGVPVYFTFEGKTCYRSDANGNYDIPTFGGPKTIYQYESTTDGVRKYVWRHPSINVENHLYVNNDYSSLTTWSSIKSNLSSRGYDEYLDHRDENLIVPMQPIYIPPVSNQNSGGHYGSGSGCPVCNGTGLLPNYDSHNYCDFNKPFVLCDVCKKKHCPDLVYHVRCDVCNK